LKPEQLTEFKRDLERLLSVRPRTRLVRGVAELFERYELVATIKRRRGCQTPPVPLASSEARADYYLSGHRTYTGRPLWLGGGGTKDLGWCPTLNALVWRHTWYSSGDNYHRIREESGGSVKVQTPGRLVETLACYRRDLRICWTPEEVRLLEAEAAAAPPPALHRWPVENGGVLSNIDPETLRPTERFSERVENYLNYRPDYPPGVLLLLRDVAGLGEGSAVADVGSGTGNLTRLLLSGGATVYGVEPNREMREAAEELLEYEENFHSVEGSAEATTLPDASVDLVTAGQAFHWFDRDRARAEFGRILKPGGHVALIWNDRRLDSTPFLREYERLLKEYGTDYKTVFGSYVRGEEGERALREFFGGEYRSARFDNFQDFDFYGLKGRLLSASYVPLPGHERHEGMLAELARIFGEHQQDGRVTIEYDTNVYYGTLR
jgi:SAM-dependent methyltransferase